MKMPLAMISSDKHNVAAIHSGSLRSIRVETGTQLVFILAASLFLLQRDGMVLDLGFLVGIDTDCCRRGWLTALDARTGDIVQADQSGRIQTFFRRGLKS